MKITTIQAAEKLGVSKAAIHNMVKHGILTDYGKTKEGETKHYFVLDSVEVATVKKHYKVRQHHSKLLAAIRNGSPVQQVLKNVQLPHDAPAAAQRSADGIFTRLDKLDAAIARLEVSMARLEAIWK